MLNCFIILSSPRKSDSSNLSELKEEVTSDNFPVARLLKLFRQLFWIVFYMGCILLMISLVLQMVSALLLPSSFSDCGSAYPYRHAAHNYPSSFWSKVIEIIQPYCHIEYYGCPPV